MSTDSSGFWKNRKVLVVDDFEMVRSMVTRAMKDLQCQKIDEAENGEVAYKKLIEASNKGEPYDLVFSDWVMPVMTGMELFDRIKEDPTLNGTPFVMFTVEADQKSVLLAVQKGIKHFMVKPVLKPKLAEKLREIEGELEVLSKKRKFNV
jgi:two-component system chemotaxis response regulator CheY